MFWCKFVGLVFMFTIFYRKSKHSYASATGFHYAWFCSCFWVYHDYRAVNDTHIVIWKYHVNGLIKKCSIFALVVSICKIPCILRNKCHVKLLLQICRKLKTSCIGHVEISRLSHVCCLSFVSWESLANLLISSPSCMLFLSSWAVLFLFYILSATRITSILILPVGFFLLCGCRLFSGPTRTPPSSLLLLYSFSRCFLISCWASINFQ